jgi:hypothetical protein
MRPQAVTASLHRFTLAMLLFLALPFDAKALSVRIAPLALLGTAADEPGGRSRPDTDLLRKLDSLPLAGSLSFAATDKIESPPLSFLDAARLCESRAYPYLVYGYLRKQESVYSAELKLLSREGKRILAIFVAGDDEEHYERLIADLSDKIAEYFLDELAIAPDNRRGDPERNLFEIPLAAGYWTPGGAWSKGLMGLFCVDIGLRFIPKRPVVGLKSRPFYIGIGLEGEYSMGRNRPECETSSMHRIQARLPLEFFLGTRGGGELGFALGGLMEFDILKQNRKYGEVHSETRSAGGFLASLMYRRFVSDRFSVGFETEYETIFYSRPLIIASPRILFEYAFAKRKAEAE